MPVTVSTGGAVRTVSMKAALRELSEDVDLAHVISDLTNGDEVTVLMRDGSLATMVWNATLKQTEHPPLAEQAPRMPPSRYTYTRYQLDGELVYHVPVSIQIDAKDKQEARELIEGILAGQREVPDDSFEVEINADHLGIGNLWGAIETNDPSSFGHDDFRILHVEAARQQPLALTWDRQ